MATEMETLFSAVGLAASGFATSDAINVKGATAFRFQRTTVGTGTVTITFSESLDGVTYVVNGTALATTLAAGTSMIDLAPKAGAFIKVIITEAGGAAATTVSLMMLQQ
jgi:hypothetical protein